MKTFNKKLLPLYILLFLSMMLGILLTWDRSTYIRDMGFVILQIWVIFVIPNGIYLFFYRKHKGILVSFLKTLLLIPFPYICLAVLMGVLVVYR